MFGITFRGKHSYRDFNLRVKSREINPPSKIKIKDSVPFMQGAYDFSGLYGDQTYEERIIRYTFDISEKDGIRLNVIKMQVMDWLLNSYKERLEDDFIPGYHFMAECENVSIKERSPIIEITATFIVYPFMIGNYDEGNVLWDEFNFETDYMQDVKFDVAGTKEIKLYNPSARSITPTVICSAPMDVIKNNTIYKFNAGITRDWRFVLDIGESNLILKGNGNIEFLFRKEVL